MNYLFITIGTRDVLVDQKAFEEILGPELAKEAYNEKGFFLAKRGGELIFTNYSSFQKIIELPILKPAFDYFNNEQLIFDKVMLIVTDQDTEQAGKYAQSDTLFLGKVISEHLKKEKQGNLPRFEKVETWSIQENVAYLDSMFHFFQQKLSNKYHSYLFEPDAHIYLLNQGGIDAINNGLMLNLLYQAGSKVKVLSENEKKKNWSELGFTGKFKARLEQKNFELALHRRDYSAILDLDTKPVVKLFTAYAHARIHFDFQEALSYLYQINDLTCRSARDEEIIDLQRLNGNSQELIKEVFWNANLKWQQGAYVDFIQRTFRIIEEFSKQEALKHLPEFIFDHEEWTNNNSFENYLKTPGRETLFQYLKQYTLKNGKPLKLSEPTVLVFISILEKMDFDTANFIKTLQKLAQLRNKGIGAHGFAPLSKNEILRKLGLKEVDFLQLWEALGQKLNAGKDPFERINAKLHKFSKT